MPDAPQGGVPAPAQTGGTIAQLREASRSGQLPGAERAVAPSLPQGGQDTGEASPEVDTGRGNAIDGMAEGEAEGEAEATEADEQQPDADDPWEQDLHGLSARAVFEALKACTLPPELAKNLKVIAKINGMELPISVEEATRGYQRLSDYTRQKNEVREQAQQVQQQLQSFDAMVQGWRQDPSQLRKGLQQLGLQDALFDSAKAIAAEWYQEQQLPPGERALKAQLRQMQEQHQQLMQQMQAAQKPPGNARAQQLTQQLGQMVPGAMQSAGVDDSPVARTYLADNLRALWEPGLELTPELVQQAAEATAEQLADLARRHSQATAPKPSPKPLPARPGAAASSGGVQQSNGQRGGFTLQDLRKAFQR